MFDIDTIDKSKEPFEKMTSLLKKYQDFNGNNQMSYFFKNLRDFLDIIPNINNMFEKNKQDPIKNLISQETAKIYKKNMETFQKLLDTGLSLLELIHSEQVILTKNNLNNKFKFLDLPDASENKLSKEELISLYETLGGTIATFSDKELKEHIHFAKYLVKENNSLIENEVNNKYKKSGKNQTNNQNI